MPKTRRGLDGELAEIVSTQLEIGATQVEAEVKREDSGAKLAKPDANQADTKAAWENPLIPNARLRQIYLAMAQVRALEKALPAAKRARTTGLGASPVEIRGLEACLVSATVGLGSGDLVSDALTGGALEYLRGAGLGTVLQHGKTARLSRRGAGVGGTNVVCGAAARLPIAMDTTERMWAALGAAAALKVAAAQTSAEAKVKDSAENVAETATGRQAGVVVVYMLVGELTTLLWKKCFMFSSYHTLPIVFIIPTNAMKLNRKAGTAKAGGVSALALGCGVPAIVVDADDAVAIYRVAQESIGHARIGGGPALMECVPYVLEGAGRRAAAQDAIAGLERTLVQRSVASRAWMEREAKRFAKLIAR